LFKILAAFALRPPLFRDEFPFFEGFDIGQKALMPADDDDLPGLHPRFVRDDELFQEAKSRQRIE